MSKRVTVNDLPETTHGEFLYCHRCGGEYSATLGDYFWLTSTGAMTCRAGHRPINLRLVRRECRIVEVES